MREAVSHLHVPTSAISRRKTGCRTLRRSRQSAHEATSREENVWYINSPNFASVSTLPLSRNHTLLRVRIAVPGYKHDDPEVLIIAPSVYDSPQLAAKTSLGRRERLRDP